MSGAHPHMLCLQYARSLHEMGTRMLFGVRTDAGAPLGVERVKVIDSHTSQTSATSLVCIKCDDPQALPTRRHRLQWAQGVHYRLCTQTPIAHTQEAAHTCTFRTRLALTESSLAPAATNSPQAVSMGQCSRNKHQNKE